MDKLIELLLSSGPPAMFVLILLFFGKNLIEYFFRETVEIKKLELNQNLENHKKNIEQENKNFQHLLDTKLQEFNIKFSNLHIERAGIIKNLYYKLIELQSSMYNYTREIHINVSNHEEEEKERIDRVNNALSDFSNYYFPNKIYFSKSITIKIDSLFKEYWNTGWDFTNVLRLQKYPNINKILTESKTDGWKEIAEKVNTFFPPLIEELENDFREIHGVN